MCPESWSVFAAEIEKDARSKSYIALYDIFKGKGNMSKEAGNFCWPSASFEYEDDHVNQDCFSMQGQTQFITDASRMRLLSLAPWDLHASTASG